MNRRRVLLLLPALSLALLLVPKPPPPPPVLTLTMIGSADQNPDAVRQGRAGRGAHLPVDPTAKFERGDVFALTEHEQQTLGQDVAASQEFVLSPGETQTKTFELKQGVQAIGIVVLYRDIDEAQWRADAPAASSGPTKLALNVGKLAITLKPS